MRILKRLEQKIDEKLRDELAGFGKCKSCNDDIFIFRHVVQHCVEYRYPVLMTFVDYKIAFDRVHETILRRVIKYYGVRLMYVNLIKSVHEHSKCRVNVSEALSNEFPVNSGVFLCCLSSS
ncbi:uncharacterized protein [Palaemon carinicauda]|uniref:uncharacterized protein n=1 Tax=Palaemon carinicauda TaxID=392227 RepID=UPI0035B5D996